MAESFNISSASDVASRNRSSRHPHFFLALLTLVSFFNYLDRMVLAVLLQPIKIDLKLTDSQLGLLSGLAFAALYATLGVPLARLADRSSRVRLLGICLALWSAMTTITGLASNFLQLFLARMGVGIGEAGCLPAAHSLIGTLYPPARRAMAVSVFQAGALCGVSGGLLITGLLAQHWGWRGALVIVGLSGLPLAAIVLATLREPARSHSGEAAPSEPFLAAVGSLLRRPAFVHLVIAVSIGGFGNYGIAQWTPSFYVRSFGLTLVGVGVSTGLATGIGGIFGMILGGALAVRLIPRDARWELWLPALTYGLSAPAFAAMFASPTFAVALGCNTLAAFLVASGGGVALSSIQSFAEPHRRATAIALTLFLSSLLGLGLAPWLIGEISDHLAAIAGVESLRFALLGSTVSLVWAAAHFFWSARSAGRS